MQTQLTAFGAAIIFFTFSTPCMENVNNTGTKYVRIMKKCDCMQTQLTALALQLFFYF